MSRYGSQADLLAEIREGVLEGSTGDLNETSERQLQLQNREDRSGYRKSTQKQRCEYGEVARCEESKA